MSENNIDAKQAAITAQTYFFELTGNRDVTIEELELSEDGFFWLVTLGYFEMPNVSSPFLMKTPTKKSLKEFKIDIDTNEVVSMKIKKI